MPAKSQPAARTIAIAMEVFAYGFTFTRSFTHPYHAQRAGPIWILRDAPRKDGDYRNEEYISHNVPPAEMNRIAREKTCGRFAVCAIHGNDEPDAPLRAGYKALGYRLRTTEPFMIQPLKKIPQFDPPAGVTIERVLTQERADHLRKATRTHQILPEHMHVDAPLRQYMATCAGRAVGWVRSITVKSTAVGHATWCSNMGVLPLYRRRGIARALLSQLLRDDRAAGSTLAVLLASHTGALLYPLLGYQQIGTLLLFTPSKK